MWIFLNDAFLSIVHKDCAKDEVLVRARIKGDLEKVFNDETLFKANPGLKPVTVTRYTKSDYLYRAVVKRDHMRAVMAAELDRVVYNNFKASTRDNKLHNAYNAVWGVMAKLQEVPPYSGNNSFGAGLFDYGDDLLPAPKKPVAKKAPAKLKKGQ
jgi:hypothetical protein